MQADLRIWRVMCRLPCQCVFARRFHREYGVAIGRAIVHARIGQAFGIFGPRPVRATGRTQVEFMQRACTQPTIRRRVKDVALIMAVRTQHQHVREGGQQGKQARTISRAKVLLVHLIKQRDVHGQDQQLVFVQSGQIALQKCVLIFAEAADIRRLLPGQGDDIIQHHKIGQRRLPGAGIGTVHTMERGKRCRIAARAGINVMVPGRV